MKHARQVIREAVIGLLSGITGVTFARSRVVKFVDLPLIQVYTDTETIDPEVRDSLNTPREYFRYLNLVIEFSMSEVTDWEDVADDYAARIEAAMAVDLTLVGTATDTELTGAELDVEIVEGRPIGSAQITYRVWYRTTAADPENAIV